MLRNSNSAWDKSSSSSDSKTESSDLAAPGSNNRVLEMTSTFLRMEVQRKKKDTQRMTTATHLHA